SRARRHGRGGRAGARRTRRRTGSSTRSSGPGPGRRCGSSEGLLGGRGGDRGGVVTGGARRGGGVGRSGGAAAEQELHHAVVGGGALRGDVIGAADQRCGEGIGRRTLRQHAPVVQHHHAVAVAGGEIQVVQHHDRGQAPPANDLQHVVQGADVE